MRNLLKVVFLSAVIVLTGCGKKDNKSSIRKARDRGNTTQFQETPNQTGGPSQTTWGIITGNDLQNQIKGFVSASSDPNSVGYVSGSSNDTTGVRFIGKVNTDDSGQVTSGAVDIVIFDSYYTEQNQDPIVISMNLIHGQINSQGGQIVFGDDFGNVTFHGSWTNGYFEGSVAYQNSQSYSGNQPYSGTLGQFQVKECGFFTCN